MNENLGHSARVLALALSLPLALGCGDTTDLDPAKPLGVTVEPQTVPTVIEVGWSTEPLSMGYVEYGTTPDMPYSTPMLSEAKVHRAQLLGLTPNTTYYYRVVTWAGNDAGASDVATLQTGALPATVPAFQVEGSGLPHYVVVPLVNTSTVVILDPAGSVVWAYADQRGLTITRARLSLDKSSVLYNAVGPAGTATPNSELVRVSLDGADETSVPIPDLGQDFVELADGAIATLVAEVQEVNGMSVRVDKIVEVRGSSITEVWSTRDCFDPAVTPGEDATQPWTNANALAFRDKSYYVSLGNFSSIAKVDPATRTCAWVLGSTGASLTLSGGEPFRHQHGMYIGEGSNPKVMVMDNDGAGANASRVLEYTFDLTAGTATQSFSYAPAGIYTATFGEPTRLPGATLVNWGAAGQLELIDSANTVVWKLVGAGTVFGYHGTSLALYNGAVRTP